MQIKFSKNMKASENQTIIDRINIAREYLGISMRKFEQSIGLSQNSLGTAVRRGSDMKTDTVTLFANKYQQFNLNWLIHGKGAMLKEDVTNEVNQVNEPSPSYGNSDPFESLLKSYIDKNSIRSKIEEVVEQKMHSMEDDFERLLAKLDPKLLKQILNKME